MYDVPSTTSTARGPRRAAMSFYFLYFAAYGSLAPFLTLFYRERGLTGEEIGSLLGISPLIGLVAGPIWSGVADATHWHRRLLALAIGAAVGATLLLLASHGFLMFMLALALFALSMAPIMPLVDSTVLEFLGDHKEDYGKLRVWGTYGWGTATLVGGFLTDWVGLSWGFYACALLMLVGLVSVMRLPITQVKMSQPFWSGLRSLVVGWPWIAFMLTLLLFYMSSATIVGFLFLHLEDLGASKSLLGIAGTIATLSEIPVFLFGQRFLKRWGARRLFMLALAGFVVRAFAYATIPAAWMVLPIQLLQGCSFGALWLASVAYASDLTPEGMSATSQGALGAVMSLGSSIGNLLAGQFYETLGAPTMFRWAAAGILSALIFFALFGERAPFGRLRRSRREAALYDRK